MATVKGTMSGQMRSPSQFTRGPVPSGVCARMGRLSILSLEAEGWASVIDSYSGQSADAKQRGKTIMTVAYCFFCSGLVSGMMTL